MRIRRYLLATEKTNGIFLSDVIRSMVFFFILDFVFPILLDPLNIYNEFLGMEAEDFVEFLMLGIIPILIFFCWSVEVSSAGYLLGLLLYLFISSAPLKIVFSFLFSDIMVILYIIAFLLDITFEHESDSPHEVDDLY
jgi:hypothetical protein